MLDIFFVVLFFIFPFIVFKYMDTIGHNIFTISVPVFLIISMFVYAYSGLLPLYFGWDEYRYNMGVQDRALIFQVLIFSIISIVGLLAGFTYAKVVLKMNNFQKFDYIRQISRKELFVLVGLIGFCFFVLFVYLSKVPSIALFVALSEGASSDSHLARSLMGNDFDGKYHWYSLIMHDLFNIVTFTLFSAFLLKKKKIIFLLFLLAFLGSSFAAVMATEKGPFAQILIGLLLVYGISLLKGKIPVKATIILLTILFSSLIVFYIFFMGSKDVFSAFGSIFSRALAGSIQPAYHYLEFFPTHQDFLMGRSFPNPGGILPIEPYRMTVEVMNWVNPNDKGIVGSMPTVFWAEAYANFGVLGVVFVPFVIGVVVYTVYYFVDKIENTPIKIGFFVWLMQHFKSLSTTGFSGYIIDFYFIMLTFILILSIAFANKFRIKYYKGKIN
ncbi:oligosaccharide repeat unit polymerase [Aliarcobacter cryaerophilus]|uniref:oligosaccharide repeat unit polymerase n=1 Tax=Aliarcobacter cryaerophilus TaxID=28198 RepID=UPI0021B33576|nr:oligosaccharide repeat unit polymerase [Aliarcobacter cryaerophilus]MCT7506074.1 oligosaccharide repeat unit polymerase [Aliarcobacter cryaerophilus]